jgi:hypothetical protein
VGVMLDVSACTVALAMGEEVGVSVALGLGLGLGEELCNVALVREELCVGVIVGDLPGVGEGVLEGELVPDGVSVLEGEVVAQQPRWRKRRRANKFRNSDAIPALCVHPRSVVVL